MNFRLIAFICLLAAAFYGCDLNSPDDTLGNDDNGSGNNEARFENVSSSNLPASALSGDSREAEAVDLQSDGDPDLVISIGQEANKILINDGNGSFSDESGRLPSGNNDSQDAAIGDYDNNSNPDLFFANNEGLTNEFYLNNGDAAFSDVSGRIPVTGNSNTSLSIDLNNDGALDLLIGNEGQNAVLINNGNAAFASEPSRIPQRLDITRDIDSTDITGDGDPDLIVGNEDDNRILINIGNGFFEDQTASRLPLLNVAEETREVALADVDDDGDLDIYYANVSVNREGTRQDRIMINDGTGIFSDQTGTRLPEFTIQSTDADFVDLTQDGAPDIVVGNLDGGIRVLVNDGNGNFTDETDSWIPSDISPRVTDLEIADFNDDQLPDIYVCSSQSEDLLLLHKE